MNRFVFYCTLTFLGLISACKTDEEQARDSVEGEWRVTETRTYFLDDSAPPITEQGLLGQFIFDQDSVTFGFSRNDTLYQGADRWYLTSEKVNQGFFRVNEFTLVIENHFTFRCRFEDETKNAEKDATQITLANELVSDRTIFYELMLDKD